MYSQNSQLPGFFMLYAPQATADTVQVEEVPLTLQNLVYFKKNGNVG